MDITVRQGDSLWYYSQLFSLSLPLLVDANRHVAPDRLSVGMRISIPGYTISAYYVAAGDSLWAIANRLGLPLDQLFLVNQQLDANHLQIGDRLLIPQRVTAKVIQGARPYWSASLQNDLRVLTDVYPFLRREVIGTSVMGKPIEEIRIGYGPKKIHFNGSFHAHEWITTPVLVEFLNEYALALTNQTAIRGLNMQAFYEEVELSVVPLVNPDGVDLVINGPPAEEPYRSSVIAMNGGATSFSGWKANIRGVDLNNQYPARWEIEAERKPRSPAPRDFPGYQPLSEPEAIAMAELTEARDFWRVLAFHTQGEVIFWGYQGLEPPEAEGIVNEFARVSGYEPIRYVDSFAGYKDWFIQEWQRPGFTVELGRGTNPLPLSQYPSIYQNALGIMLAALYM
ncbi:M14 family metallopeptidase [Halalkalibacter oceani]|uniref:M14 family metallopeptidase n=1 Tax=Halalkalibacter oceani TaxID=1653776 RepID=A0A9X2DVP9_9BACI|nr:M14 family metallopeptidase [Halalkalibacter oceani]MCM3716203.1 M14 family metallopeptidase [Halalkalibacter oceani]